MYSIMMIIIGISSFKNLSIEHFAARLKQAKTPTEDNFDDLAKRQILMTI